MKVANRKLWWLLPVVVFGLGGIYWIGLSCVGLQAYFAEPNHPLRGECIEGTGLTLFVSLPFWILVSIFAFPVRHVVPKFFYFALNVPLVVFGICGLFMIMTS